MICEQALELMSAQIDGELSEEQRQQLQAHLDACPACRSVMESLSGLDRAVSALEEPAPEGLKQGVLYRIGQETGAIKKPKKRWFGPGTGFGLVAAALVLLVGTGLIPLGRSSDTALSPADTAASPGKYDTNNSVWQRTPDSSEDIGFVLPDHKGPVRGTDYYGSPNTAGSAPQPNEADATSDSYYLDGDKAASDTVLPVVPMDESLRRMGEELSRSTGQPVLLYTEADLPSMAELLRAEEPKLARLLEDAASDPLENGYVACAVDYRTALAVHEWLLANLPRSEEMPAALREAETGLMMRMEQLDPESGSLYSVITWAPRAKPVVWPGCWPDGWAVRLRTGENWALFFPEADSAPLRSDPALLVFAPSIK